jgi:anti-sigma factor RsiW
VKPVAHLTCRELVELVTDYLEGRLEIDDRTELEMHLTLCDPCVAYVEQMRGIVRGAGRLAEEDLPADVRDGLLAAFRGWKGRAR